MKGVKDTKDVKGIGLAAGAQEPIDVYFVVLPGSLILDWAGPAEALRIANALHVAAGQAPAFQLHFVGPLPEAMSSVGAVVSQLGPLPTASTLGHARPVWLVLLGQVGPSLPLYTPGVREVLAWLAQVRLQRARVELLTVCAGAVLAAHAGLLDGHQATTHHQHLEELRRAAPRCQVQSNRVFVLDGPVSTSAGVTTGIDLILHRLAQVGGPALAAQVAQTMVMALRRGPADPEFSPFLRYRNHLHAALHRVQDRVSQQPLEPWTAQRMAEVACTSPRHLTRLFLQHAGVSPMVYLRQIRLDLAEVALRSGHNVTTAASMGGFSSATQLRRAWAQLGKAGSPSGVLTR